MRRTSPYRYRSPGSKPLGFLSLRRFSSKSFSSSVWMRSALVSLSFSISSCPKISRKVGEFLNKKRWKISKLLTLSNAYQYNASSIPLYLMILNCFLRSCQRLSNGLLILYAFKYCPKVSLKPMSLYIILQNIYIADY